MEYFKLLHLVKEPFSNSPDPSFFYGSEQHTGCIQKLEIALRLRRGLNVVTGEVGAGKTTLCRQLLRILSGDPQVSAHLILDPDFSEPRLFLSVIIHLITGLAPDPDAPVPAMKESLKHHLFEKGVEEDKTIVLIVDEGQKMPSACLEILRELLNFETNDHKLLQIVIFAQTEFAETLRNIPNLADRVNLYYPLSPLCFRDSVALIRHRIRLAEDPETTGTILFSIPALWRIHHLSGGYPRKIIHLCHQCLLAMIIQNRSVAGWRMVGACAERTLAGRTSHFRPVRSAAALLLAAFCVGIWAYAAPLRESAALLRSHWKNPAPGRATAAISLPEAATAANASALAPASENSPSPSSLSSSFDAGRSTLDAGRSSLSTPTSSTQDPAVLGTIPVAVGDTLEGLVRRVYGGFTYRYHQAVLAENPQLKAPNRLSVGDLISFPAVKADVTDFPDTTWWISVKKESDLGAAISKLRETADSLFPLRILSIWNPRDGLSFQVVVKTCFQDQTSAEQEKKRMAPQELLSAEIICLKKNDTRFYGSIAEHQTSDDRKTDEHQTSF